MEKITITWHGHSCFTISADNYSIVFDPYEPDSVPGLPPLSLVANQVLLSHSHGDHGYAEAVHILDVVKKNPFKVSVIDTWHDDAKGTLRGFNKIHILDGGNLKAAHLGDLGCELEPNQIEMLKGLDALMIPVGGFFTIDAAQAGKLVKILTPKVVIPMHYRSDSFGFPVISRLEDFTVLCDNAVYYDRNSITITENTKEQTAILKLN